MTENEVKKIAHDYIKENLRVEVSIDSIRFSYNMEITVKTILDGEVIQEHSDTLRMPKTEE